MGTGGKWWAGELNGRRVVESASELRGGSASVVSGKSTWESSGGSAA